MTIKSYMCLSKKANKEVLNLESVCIDYDDLGGGFFLDPSLNFDDRIKSFFLFYENNFLISMLSMSVPTKHEAEITAYTLPKYRGEGYFKLLLGKAVEELRKFNIPEILFVCESASISGKQVINAFNADYDHTEYFLRFDLASYTSLNTYRLIVFRAEQKDIEKAIAAHMKAFDDSYEDSRSIIHNYFEPNMREQYLAVLNDQIIGVGSANLEGEDVSIFGLGLFPEYRGKGYGKELLHLIVDSLLKRERTEITIEVNSENANALMLYKKTGFHKEVAYEYYRIKVNEVL